MGARGGVPLSLGSKAHSFLSKWYGARPLVGETAGRRDLGLGEALENGMVGPWCFSVEGLVAAPTPARGLWRQGDKCQGPSTQVPVISSPAFLSRKPGPQSSQTWAIRSHQQPALWDSCSWAHLKGSMGRPPSSRAQPSTAPLHLGGLLEHLQPRGP